MYDFTFFTMPQGIIRCKDTKKRRKERSLLFFLDNIIFLRKPLPWSDCGTGSVGQHVKQMCIYCSENHEIPISLIHNSFSYHCTPNVVIANGFDLKRLGLRKLGVKFCFALCWTFSKTRTGNRTKDLPPLLSNPWFGECLNDRHLTMLNFKWVSDQSTTLQHGKIEPKNWKSALLINHNVCLNIIGNNIPLQPKSIT